MINIENKLILVFKKKFSLQLKNNQIKKLSRENFSKWDSLEHLNLIMMIEKDFKIKFKIKEIVDSKSFTKILKFILKK
jgi:acyl carrier protein